jgi:hypothetical protein
VDIPGPGTGSGTNRREVRQAMKQDKGTTRAGKRPDRAGSGPERSPLVSVHIPKTAGITFHGILTRMYGKRLHLDYGPDPYATTGLILETVYGGEGGQERLYEAVRRDRIRCIHGHFPAEKYHALFPDSEFLAWLRDPAERVISEFFFCRNLARPFSDVDRLVQEGIINIREFAEMEQNRNRQSRMLSNVPFEKFVFIGLCEFFEESVRVFSRTFGVPIDPKRVKSKNRNERKPVLSDESVKDYIRSLNPDDQHLYRTVKERYGGAARP